MKANSTVRDQLALFVPTASIPTQINFDRWILIVYDAARRHPRSLLANPELSIAHDVLS